MIKAIKTRLKQGFRTMSYPKGDVFMPDRFRGLPKINRSLCVPGCVGCKGICPVDAFVPSEHGLTIDMGRCLFCGECARSCPKGAVTFTQEFRLASSSRSQLITDGEAPKIEKLKKDMRRIFGRSLKLRQVSAGGCNACEADVNVLGTLAFDLGRFGIQFVASPRHADGLLVTGPVTKNMKLALKKSYDAVPSPKIVIASGSCAISGGPFRGHDECNDGIGDLLHVDLFIPGCPPHPMTVLDGMLKLLGKLNFPQAV